MDRNQTRQPADISCPMTRYAHAMRAGSLPESERAWIAAHVSTCQSCAEVITEGSVADGSASERYSGAAESDRVAKTRTFVGVPGECGVELSFGPPPSPQAMTATRPYTEEIPDRIGRFCVRRLLGEGSFGRVFLAEDPELDRPVAIKVPSFDGPDSRASSSTVESFLAEAKAAARLRHPGIVTIYDVFRGIDGSCNIAMEYVEGHCLKSLIGLGRIDAEHAARIIEDAATAIHYAHKRGLVHRDLKPSNLLLDANRQVKIADFGLALPESMQRMRAGEFAGTPAYMSPEQVRGESHHLDGRADIWSLGVILYEMLTKRRPFGGDRSELLDEIVSRPAKPLRQLDDGIPAELERICLRCLQKDPANRYATARDLADELKKWRAAASGRAISKWARSAAGVLCGILLVGVLVPVFSPVGRENQPSMDRTGKTGVDARPKKRARPLQEPLDATEPYVWSELLRTPPSAMFPHQAEGEHWVFDENRRSVLLDSRGATVVSIGETASSWYRLQVTISKNAAIGTAGVFLGCKPGVLSDGTQGWLLQMLCLKWTGEGHLRIDRELAELKPTPGGSFGINKRLVATARPANLELHNGLLEITVRPDEINEVRWQGELLEPLGEQAIDAEEGPANVDGKIGLVNYFGTTTFSDARFMLLRRAK